MTDSTITVGEIEVQRLAHRKRSRLDRSIYRSAHGRNDAEIMKAWLLRAARRMPSVYVVDEPEWRYSADAHGPGGTQVAVVRAVLARDDYERDLFGRGFKARKGVPVIRYVIPPRINYWDFT